MKKKLISFLSIVLFLPAFVAQGQYYYFDSGTVTYPYQQGCSEKLNVNVNTEDNLQGARAGRFHLVLDPLYFDYLTSDTVSVLRSDLFTVSSTTFLDWSSLLSPSWKTGSNKTILQVDRKNNLTDYKGSNGLYGVISFMPVYNSSTYEGSFGMEYNPGTDTTETTLSAPGGVEIINPTSQNFYRTGTYSVLQEPCVADINNPLISISTPTVGNKKVHTDGVILSLTDNGGVSGISNVPYVWSGSDRTGNVGGVISNQYGIDPSTFVLYISGNGTGKQYTQSNSVFSTGPEITWQGNARNFGVNINPSELFDWGIEKTITITGTVSDRIGRVYNLASYSFNQAQAPTLIAGSQSPLPGANFVNLGTQVKLGIKDEWAGVDSGSIVVTLSGINGTSYGPFLFSGTDLNLSGIVGIANELDQYITINHSDFPTSGTIRVSVYAEDMEGTVDNISDYSFTTRPDCSEFQCCNPIDLKWRSSTIPYINPGLTVIGGIDTYFTGEVGEATGYLYCGTENEGMLLYSGHGNFTGDASMLEFSDMSELLFSGSNVVAYLTGDNGDTILLVKFGNFVFKVYPSNRPSLDYTNIGQIRFYDINRNFVLSGIIESSSTGYANWLDNIPSGTYYAVYKGQSQLASYLSGVEIVQGEEFVLDFTTGANLYNVLDGSYQIAGDLKSSLGLYDFMINGNDIAIVTESGFVDSYILDPKNLNGDSVVSAMDIAVIGNNFELTDPFYYEYSLFSW